MANQSSSDQKRPLNEDSEDEGFILVQKKKRTKTAPVTVNKGSKYPKFKVIATCQAEGYRHVADLEKRFPRIREQSRVTTTNQAEWIITAFTEEAVQFIKDSKIPRSLI